MSICCLIVTYGDRRKFITPIIARLKEVSIPTIIVSNGSMREYELFLRDEFEKSDDVYLAILGENIGSAGGFNYGLRYFYGETDFKFCLILDDDNLPSIESFEEYKKIANTSQAWEKPQCYMSVREDREYLKMLAGGYAVDLLFKSDDRFMGFNILPLNLPNAFKDLEYMPYCPYGGLLLNRSCVDVIGYPNAEFVLYSDDIEYTSRLRSHGIRIKLLRSTSLQDLDKSWHVKKGSKIDNIIDADGFRIYYQIRNQVYFDLYIMRDKSIIYFFNAAAFIFAVTLKSILKLRFKNLFIVISAISHGYKRNLGMSMRLG